MVLNFLLNKSILVKRVNPDNPGKRGDFVLMDKEICVFFLWSSKRYILDQIEQIRIYWDTSLGLEEFWCIDIQFPAGIVVYLDGSILEHQRMTNYLLSLLGRKIIDFKNLPMKESNSELIYSKGMYPTSTL